jgi:hypothetical protein
LQRISKIIIAMQKSEYISMPEAGKTERKVNMANLKVSRANAQSRPGGILFAPANGKLYFEAFGINSMLQNNLPHAGEGNAPKSHFRQKTVITKIPKIWQQKKTDRVRSGANPKPTPAGIVTQSI